ncbi:hypothetical protein CQW23_05004 [Capsicum baccatum]|uniref:Uncharacterized protein n=1 Tax=Capsicum baccatum TaxID=33114 RepID=A0A2G2XG98_CAPBA|nr:hypothetical protein CQW23_05004 [Capsicum baccatum]
MAPYFHWPLAAAADVGWCVLCGVFIVAYVEYLSHGKSIPSRYFDAEAFRTRYAALLCKHETQKNEIGAVSDDESPDKSVRPQFECESSDMIIIS